MKTFGLNSITTFLTLMVLFNLVNTPAVKTGPVSFASCVLGCCGTVCKGVAIACLPLGAATGPLGYITAYGCFLAAGGGCAACVSVCAGAGAAPTP